jgi:two-component system, NarL family, sensor kinase
MHKLKHQGLTFILVFFALVFCAQNKGVDSLEQAIKDHKTADTVKTNLYTELCWAYIFSDLPKAFSAANKGLDLASEINDKKAIAQAHHNLGTVYVVWSKYPESKAEFEKALLIRREIGDKRNIAATLVNLSTIENNLGNYSAALNLNFESLKIFEQLNEKLSVNATLGNIGAIYYVLNNNEKALEYGKKAFAGNKEDNDKGRMAGDAVNIGNIYVDYKNYEEAEKYYLIALENFNSVNNKTKVCTVLFSMGTMYIKTGDYEKALENLNKVLELARETENVRDEAGTLIALGNVNHELKNFKDAEKYYAEGIVLSKKFGFRNVMKNGLKGMFNYYSAIGDYKNALKYYENFTAVKDSLVNEAGLKQVAEMQTKYETEKKEDLLKLSDLALEKQKQKSFYATITFVIAIFVMILSVWIFYYRYKTKQKIKFETEIRKQEALRYEAVIETLEKERNRIGKELHDNTGALVSYIISKTDFIANSEQGTKEDLETVNSSAKEVLTSLRETLWTLNNKSITNIDLIDKLKVYIKKHLLIPNKITDDSKTEHILLNDAVLALYRCVQEIINNTNKHSKANNANIIFTSSEKIKFGIMIQDDGIGFTAEEKEESYGIRNLKSRLKDINGELDISSEINKGTSISINY